MPKSNNIKSKIDTSPSRLSGKGRTKKSIVFNDIKRSLKTKDQSDQTFDNEIKLQEELKIQKQMKSVQDPRSRLGSDLGVIEEGMSYTEIPNEGQTFQNQNTRSKDSQVTKGKRINTLNRKRQDKVSINVEPLQNNLVKNFQESMQNEIININIPQVRR